MAGRVGVGRAGCNGVWPGRCGAWRIGVGMARPALLRGGPVPARDGVSRAVQGPPGPREGTAPDREGAVPAHSLTRSTVLPSLLPERIVSCTSAIFSHGSTRHTGKLIRPAAMSSASGWSAS